MTLDVIIKKTGDIVLESDRSTDGSVSKRLIYNPKNGYGLQIKNKVKGTAYRLWSTNPAAIFKKYNEVAVVEV
jgi:hypothetical protein